MMANAVLRRLRPACLAGLQECEATRTEASEDIATVSRRRRRRCRLGANLHPVAVTFQIYLYRSMPLLNWSKIEPMFFSYSSRCFAPVSNISPNRSS